MWAPISSDLSLQLKQYLLLQAQHLDIVVHDCWLNFGKCTIMVMEAQAPYA